jgi:hypothetical protein
MGRGLHVYRWVLVVSLGALLAGCGGGASNSSAPTTGPTAPAATGPFHPYAESPKEAAEEAKKEAEVAKEESEEAKKESEEAKRSEEKH